MRVCFFNSNPEWGGGEKWHFDFSTLLAKNGYEVAVFTNKKSQLHQKLLSNTAVSLHELKITNLSFLNPLKLISLVHKFRELNFDVIIMNLPSDLKIAGLAAKLAKVNSIIYRRGSAIPIKNKPLNRLLFGSVVTEIIANSEETKRTIVKNNPHLFPLEKIHVIYNGIDLTNYSLSDEQLDPDLDGAVIIGNVGRLCYQKGQELLIEIAQILKEKGLKFQVKIAGIGELESDLKELVRKLGLEEYVSFVGFVENISKFLNQIDIFALTSHWEGFGYVIAEAMACKKPVVAFDISSNPELINHGETGYLVKYPDKDSFAEFILELASKAEKRIEFGENGHERIKKQFLIQQAIEKLIQLIEKGDRNHL